MSSCECGLHGSEEGLRLGNYSHLPLKYTDFIKIRTKLTYFFLHFRPPGLVWEIV